MTWKEASGSARAVRAALLVVAIAVAGSLAGPVGAAPAPSGGVISPEAAASYCPSSEDSTFLSLINQYRAQHGRGSLRLTTTLGAAAQHHSTDMATNNYFSHTLSDGTSWSQNMTNYGYTYSTYRGENIAAGYASAQSTFDQWKASSTHNANMLSPNFRAIGIARAYNSSSTYQWYWTTDFGGYADAAVTC